MSRYGRISLLNVTLSTIIPWQKLCPRRSVSPSLIKRALTIVIASSLAGKIVRDCSSACPSKMISFRRSSNRSSSHRFLTSPCVILPTPKPVLVPSPTPATKPSLIFTCSLFIAFSSILYRDPGRQHRHLRQCCSSCPLRHCANVKTRLHNIAFTIILIAVAVLFFDNRFHHLP